MKKAVKALVITAVVVFGIWAIWFFGDIFEFEYPYTFTLMKVRNAQSVNGIPVSQIIKGGGHWHTCSYCADGCGDVEGLVCVHLSGTGDYFAYSYDTHTLVPLNARTAADYPSLMPSNDPVRLVMEMNGNTGVQGNGYGDFKLPEKWFHKVTHTETNNAVTGGAVSNSKTN